MIVPPDLAPRYAPGEDIRPLLRAGLGGSLGVTAALVVDGLITATDLPRWLGPAVWADAVTADPSRWPVGLATMVSLGLAAALVYAYGVYSVYVLQGNQVQQREVKIGDRVGDQVEIAGGLTEGEQIATPLNQGQVLFGGAAVEVAP